MMSERGKFLCKLTYKGYKIVISIKYSLLGCHLRFFKRQTPRQDSVQFSSVQSLSHVRFFATPRITARQASLFITNSQSSLRLMSIELLCHPAISSSLVPFSSCPQSFPASGSFPVSQFFASSGQSIGASASTSVPPMNIQD